MYLATEILNIIAKSKELHMLNCMLLVFNIFITSMLYMYLFIYLFICLFIFV